MMKTNPKSLSIKVVFKKRPKYSLTFISRGPDCVSLAPSHLWTNRVDSYEVNNQSDL